MPKPTTPQGTRDFAPQVMRKRSYILDTIRSIFVKYGFEQLETPALENLETLTGKYGDEGDKLLYKIRSNKEISQEIGKDKIELLKELLPDRWIPGKSKLGLRYDLTVPFARFVVQNRNDITFPFRRYQIQPVWRADRPQKGRFREFTQCDADCIGSNSLLHEADLIRIYDEAFTALGLEGAVLKINHRKFLEAMVELLEIDFPVGRFTTALDKLDKIGVEGVTKELIGYGVSEDKCTDLFQLIDSVELNTNGLQILEEKFSGNETAQKAIQDVAAATRFLEGFKPSITIQLDLSLARGLDYYTGCIFEALVPNSGIGSISGGGRYDDLTGIFGLKDVSGVGISFGIDRIYEILEDRNLWPENLHSVSSVVICHFDEKTMQHANKVAAELRKHNVAVIVYPDNKRINKQFDYANKIRARYAVVIGDNEIESNTLSIKDLKIGSQETFSLEGALNLFSQ